MSGVCGLSVLETHRISRATRTANVMSLFVFCEMRVAGGGELRCPLSYTDSHVLPKSYVGIEN